MGSRRNGGKAGEGCQDSGGGERGAAGGLARRGAITTDMDGIWRSSADGDAISDGCLEGERRAGGSVGGRRRTGSVNKETGAPASCVGALWPTCRCKFARARQQRRASRPPCARLSTTPSQRPSTVPSPYPPPSSPSKLSVDGLCPDGLVRRSVPLAGPHCVREQRPQESARAASPTLTSAALPSFPSTLARRLLADRRSGSYRSDDRDRRGPPPSRRDE